MFKKNLEIPRGLRWIKDICYLGIIGGIFMLGFIGILQATPFSNIFSNLFNPMITSIFAGVSIIAWILVLVGIKKRNILFWKLTFGWLLIYLAYTLATNIKFLISLNIFSLIGQLIWLGIIITLIWYIYKRKDYYKLNKLPSEFPVDKTEKIFKIVLISLIVLLLAVFLFLPKGIEMYNLSRWVNILGEDRFNPEKAIPICEKQSGEFRDYCLLQTMSVNVEKYEFTLEYCEKMINKEHYDTCQLMFYNCEKIGNEQTKNLCTQLKQLANQP